MDLAGPVGSEVSGPTGPPAATSAIAGLHNDVFLVFVRLGALDGVQRWEPRVDQRDDDFTSERFGRPKGRVARPHRS